MSEPHANPTRPVAGVTHTIGLLIIIAAWAWLGAIGAGNMRANSGRSLIALYSTTVAFEWLVLAYVVWGVRRRRRSLRELIGGIWTGGRDFGRDVLVAIGFWFLALPCLLVLGLVLGIDHNAQAVRFIVPHSKAEITLWILVSCTAGFCEEIIFRGYLQRQFLAWSNKALVGILLSAVAFGGVHAYQGAKQTVRLGAFGAMFGILAYRRRSLRPGMMAHAWNDAVLGLAMRAILK